ncbi:MAG: hypothetical protein EU529_16295 [Promethearchaeota archaeon]|nr:MAG: hypothetical protein EU529_16295 [Candidatus Lokiarchaeota archaeon]
MNLVFSYFDQIKGPEIFYSLPEEISEKFSKAIKGIFDSTIDNPYFEYILKDQKIISLNFEIPSDWARGNNEMVMISIISDKDLKSEHFYDLLKEVSNKIKSDMNIYKSLYIKDKTTVEDKEIDEKYTELRQLLFSSFDKLEKKIKELKIMELMSSRELSLAGAHRVFGTIITACISCILQEKPLVLCGDIDASNALLNIFNRIFLDIHSLDDKVTIKKDCHDISPNCLVINTKLGIFDSGKISDEAHNAISRYLNEAEKKGNDDAAIIFIRQRLSILMKVADFLKEVLSEKKSIKQIIKVIKSDLRIKIKNDELYAVQLILKARDEEEVANRIIMSKLNNF